LHWILLLCRFDIELWWKIVEDSIAELVDRGIITAASTTAS
jgi:hypothetical protein